jgi:hypothetical protein
MSAPARRSLVAAALVLVLAPVRARATSLGELLAAVASNDRFPSPARAEFHGEQRIGDGSRAIRGVLIGSRRTVYVETDRGTRALVRPGKVVLAQAGGRTHAERGAPLPGTDLLLEDLAPFTVARLTMPQISDEGPTGVVVNSAPAAWSAYVLLVHVVDPERATVVRTQYYRDAISELVKMRRDDAFVQVANHWRPTDVTVESFRDKSVTHLTLSWAPAGDVAPDVFTPAGLRGASRLGAAP